MPKLSSLAKLLRMRSKCYNKVEATLCGSDHKYNN